MLIGTTETSMDDKGRLTITLKWRAELAMGTIITRGFDKCLYIYPQAQFKKIALEVDKWNIALSVVRAFARYLTMLAEYAELDKRGRIKLPQNLCQFAELGSEVLVVGVINRLEVWNPKLFAECNSQSSDNPKSVAEKFGSMIYHSSRRDK